jgi:hypothetical protein
MQPLPGEGWAGSAESKEPFLLQAHPHRHQSPRGGELVDQGDVSKAFEAGSLTGQQLEGIRRFDEAFKVC